MNGWIDDSDLPKLQSIQFAPGALDGDNRADRTTINDKPYIMQEGKGSVPAVTGPANVEVILDRTPLDRKSVV